MKIILCIALYFVTNQAARVELKINSELNDYWEAYKTEFEKKYDSMTELSRRMIWEENLKYIKQHNLEYDLGKKNFTVGLNEFSDMNEVEFKNKILVNFPMNEKHQIVSPKEFITQQSKMQIPDNWDWRKKGAVSPVGNQLNCNCGYAFAAIGALEAQNFNLTGSMDVLSKQQIIDCSITYGNLGCNGGVVSKTYAYLADYGSEPEEDYPFTASIGNCRYAKSMATIKPFGFKYVARGKESDLVNAVYNIGPTSVFIDASLPTFKQYKGGIYDDTNCSSVNLNHSVLVIGYGEENGQAFWLIKNSFGIKWGIKGYMKIARDFNNLCGIASWASVPLIRMK